MCCVCAPCKAGTTHLIMHCAHGLCVLTLRRERCLRCLSLDPLDLLGTYAHRYIISATRVDRYVCVDPFTLLPCLPCDVICPCACVRWSQKLQVQSHKCVPPPRAVVLSSLPGQNRHRRKRHHRARTKKSAESSHHGLFSPIAYDMCQNACTFT